VPNVRAGVVAVSVAQDLGTRVATKYQIAAPIGGKMGSTAKRDDSSMVACRNIEPFATKKSINVVVETPKGKRNKFAFDEDLDVFRLKKVLPAGEAFPYDFGFVPGTRADDGDPIDVMLLMDESAYPGCLVEARLVGVIEAEQEVEGETVRNDRLVAVAEEAHDYHHIKTMADIDKSLLKELEHFFVSYNEARGIKFRLLNARGPQHARTLLKVSIKKKASQKVAKRRRKAK
jgi:inorganic pyrophosphatase